MNLEADTRIFIDKLLEQEGGFTTNKAPVSTEEAAADGHVDYLLKDSENRPLAVFEAKRLAIEAYTTKEQAKAFRASRREL